MSLKDIVEYIWFTPISNTAWAIIIGFTVLAIVSMIVSAMGDKQ